jgi:hypothetical protein
MNLATTSKRGAALAALLLPVCACAAEPTAPEPVEDDSEVVSASASSLGTLDGAPVSFREAAADSLDRLRSGDKITLAGSRIELSTGASICTEYKKNAKEIEIQFQNNDGDVTPGSVYPIGSNETHRAFSRATWSVSGNDCARVGAAIQATGGFVKIVKASSQALRGEFELVFGAHGSVKGTFAAPTCIKKRDYDASSTPACRK